MSSTIHNCTYDPNGGKNYQPINPLTSLQSGPLSISHLIHEIAEKDFGYHGTEKYTLTLRNSQMVLEIWESPDGLNKNEFGTLTLNDNQWKLTKSNDVTIKEDPAQISNRVNHTLKQIRHAYEKATSSIPSPQLTNSSMNPSTPSEGSTSPNSTSSPTPAPIVNNVNNYITCNPEPAEILTPFLQEQSKINEYFFSKLQELQDQLRMLGQEIIFLRNLQNEDLKEKQLEDENLLKHLRTLQKETAEDIGILKLENRRVEKLLKLTKEDIEDTIQKHTK